MKYIFFRGLISSTILLLALILPIKTLDAAATAGVSSPYYYNFNDPGILNEAGSLNLSTSPYWWLNSGGLFTLAGGEGKTVQGNLSDLSPWRLVYSLSNPTDTDNGYHPQNIFRLITRSTWQDIREEAYFKIAKDNVSQSSNRNASNGILLMNRYYTSANLYYAGIRVDGAAVIKKKIGGRYYTLAYKKIFPGTYDRTASPNLLPKNTWIGLRTEVENTPTGGVSVKLFMDHGKTGTWTQILETTDTGTGGGALTGSGYAGIRTDFMDVVFDDFRVVGI